MKNTIIRMSALFVFITAGYMANAQLLIIEHYTTKAFDCAIFPETSLASVDGTRFTPTHDDVDKAEQALTEDLKLVKCPKAQYDDQKEIAKKLAKYKLQIIGYTDNEGNKTLLINAFRNDKDKDKGIAEDWLKQIIQVKDGGLYFWNIKYDIAKNHLFDFVINGNG